MAFHFLNSKRLYRIAKTAYGKTKGELTPDQPDALVAIVFSAAALEAFILELDLIVKSARIPDGRVKAAAEVISLTEECRGSVQRKYELAKVKLCGHGYDKGKEPYQGFQTLFLIRNALVHVRPSVVAFGSDGDDLGDIEKHLKGKPFMVPTRDNVLADWIERVSTRAAARWACNVIVEMVKSMRKAALSGSMSAKSKEALEKWGVGMDKKVE